MNSAKLSSVKILLIEPDRSMGKMLAEAFELDGHSVDVRRDGQHSLDGVDHHNPDVIVLEPQLGKHNGVEFLFELRSHSDWQNIPVVLYSANRQVLGKEFEKGWEQLGVKQILYKPETSIAKLKKIVIAAKP